MLALNARAAWAHDWVTTPMLDARLPNAAGGEFYRYRRHARSQLGAASAGGELRFLNGWSIGGRFDGEFADRAQTYAGTGVIRYTF